MGQPIDDIWHLGGLECQEMLLTQYYFQFPDYKLNEFEQTEWIQTIVLSGHLVIYGIINDFV